jgi:hypothetical protein
MRGKTIDLKYTNSASPVTGGSGLYCKFRAPSKNETIKAAHRGIVVEAVVEIARQGTVDLAAVKPRMYRFTYGNVYWEINDVTYDDWETTSSGKIDAAVYMFHVSRMDSAGIGEIAGA